MLIFAVLNLKTSVAAYIGLAFNLCYQVVMFLFERIFCKPIKRHQCFNKVIKQRAVLLYNLFFSLLLFYRF